MDFLINKKRLIVGTKLIVMGNKRFTMICVLCGGKRWASGDGFTFFAGSFEGVES